MKRKAVLSAGVALVALAGTVSAKVVATGGDATNDLGYYRIHVFTNVGEHAFDVIAGGEIKVLVVGGGGGGGETIGGGGGGGGVIYSNAFPVEAGSNYTVMVGDGGAGGWGGGYPAGVKGDDSVFEDLTAIGGGAGAGYNVAASGTGGSAGGNGGAGGARAGYTAGQGHDGGVHSVLSANNLGGGGGGAGATGTNATTLVGGHGGTGRAIDITGETVYYGGGGGGGVRSGGSRVGGNGGLGGGGAGGTAGQTGTNGLANTGGGGGGGGYSPEMAGGAGGSGIVIVRYLNVQDSDPLSVTADAATGIGITNATLNGQVGGFGGAEAPYLYLCWDTEDRETSGTGVWYRVISLGNSWEPGESFSHDVFDFEMGHTYVYRVYATNGVEDEAWSDAQLFSTYGKPTVVQDGANSLKYSANLIGEVTDTGGAVPTAGFEWWLSGGGETSSVAVGYADSAYAATVDGLTPNQTYGFRAWASNEIGGIAFSSDGSFETLVDTPNAYTWTGANNNDWFTFGNWTNTAGNPGIPETGDSARIPSGTVLLTTETAVLTSFSIANASLTLSNWTTRLRATTVTVENGGELTLPAAFTDAGPSNRVWVVCEDFNLHDGGTVDADARGFSGGAQSAGHGPGKGLYTGGGAGYGGVGGDSSAVLGGVAYGSTAAPTDPGSGGSGDSVAGRIGGHGGGAVRIEATGTVTIDGLIAADAGTASAYSGGGSGGGVYITCDTFGGDGTITANGSPGLNGKGSGAGGRIAVDYQTLDGVPTVRMEATQAAGPWATWIRNPNYPQYNDSGIGSLYFSKTNLLGQIVSNLSGKLEIPGFTAWSPASLTVSNRVLQLPDDFSLTVAGGLTVGPDGALVLEGRPNVSAGGDIRVDGGDLVINVCTQLTGNAGMVVTNGGAVWLAAGTTNAATARYGGRVSITGQMAIGPNAWVYPVSDATNGGSLLFQMAGLSIAQTGGMDASGYGFRGGFPGAGYGPGKSAGAKAGAGHGGQGGNWSTTAGGDVYSSSNAPVMPGSGGGGDGSVRYGGAGGGLVWIEADGTVTVNGAIRANAAVPLAYTASGSGGGIFIACNVFTGAEGAVLEANGRNGSSNGGGGGGGGRIAVAVGLDQADVDRLVAGQSVAGLVTYPRHGDFLGTLSVTNGIGYSSGGPGTPGTALFEGVSKLLTIAGSPAEYGSPEPLPYGSHLVATDAWVTNSVSTPTNASPDTRHACIGWALSDAGNPVDSGAGTQAIFQVTNNLNLTWSWTNEYQLTVSADANGTVTEEKSGWYTNGLTVTEILASPGEGYEFNVWTGSGVPAGQESQNPLTVTMTQARAIQATFASTTGETKVWSGTGQWSSGANWDPSGMPGSLDDAVIAAGTVTVAFARQVNSVVISNHAAILFTNWTSSLTVNDAFTIQSNGLVTLPAAFPDAGPSNRIWVVCEDFTLQAGGTINVTAKGFSGGEQSAGHGPGKGLYGGGGAGHGGVGGDTSGAALGGTIYGSAAAPLDPGSGGSGHSVAGRIGGHGGGAVRIEASGTVTIDGLIAANAGSAGAYSGGGSGGGVFITCDTFGGDGTITANGTAGNNGTGSGAGGRIAVDYQALEGVPAVRMEATQAAGPWAAWFQNPNWPQYHDSGIGSLYFSKTNLLGQIVSNLSGKLEIPGFTAWSPASLTVSNRVLQLPDDFSLNVAGGLTVGPDGALVLEGHPNVSAGGNIRVDGGDLVINVCTQLTGNAGMVVTNGGAVWLAAGTTNAATARYGGRVSITGQMEIGPNAWVYPVSDATNGGSLLFRVAGLSIAQTGGMDASGYGFRGGFPGAGYGPGKSAGAKAGAGYGGQGGNWSTTEGGDVYSSSNAPVMPGSGGGGDGSVRYGGAGGGLVWIEADGTVTVNGAIRANAAVPVAYTASGSGGGIFIACNAFTGAEGAVLEANGRNGSSNGGGGGGGGRIAVWQGVPAERVQGIIDGSNMKRVLTAETTEDFSGSMFVSGGIGGGGGGDGTDGSIVFLSIDPPGGTVFLFR